MADPESAAPIDAEHVPPTKLWFGHPPQLARLFTTEMWERFGYYGIRALLVLYLTQWFMFDDQTAGGLYGGFVGLVYLTPLFGGLIADRVFGSKHSVKVTLTATSESAGHRAVTAKRTLTLIKR